MQVIEEQRQRMLRSRKSANEMPQGCFEQAASLLRRQIGGRRLLADHQLDFGYQRGHELSVDTQRLPQCVSPDLKLGIARAHQAENQPLQGLGDRLVRNIVSVLVELARSE